MNDFRDNSVQQVLAFAAHPFAAHRLIVRAEDFRLDWTCRH
jgi:hypothetical protein